MTSQLTEGERTRRGARGRGRRGNRTRFSVLCPSLPMIVMHHHIPPSSSMPPVIIVPSSYDRELNPLWSYAPLIHSCHADRRENRDLDGRSPTTSACVLVSITMAPVHTAATRGDVEEVERLIRRDPGVVHSRK